MSEIKKTYPIKGMHCASCVRLIERALSRTPGVKDATVNLATEKATVTFDPQNCTEENISAAVESVGYRIPSEDEILPEDQEKIEKARELKKLQFKVAISLLLGGLIFWGSFPGIMETAP